VPLARLYRAFHDARMRARWLPEVDLTVRTATREKSMRITWPDRTSVVVGFERKGPAKSLVALQHGKLPDQAVATRVKQYWASGWARWKRCWRPSRLLTGSGKGRHDAAGPCRRSSTIMARTDKKRRTCPHCGSQRCVRVAYGMPGPELQEQAERGEVVLGGCVVWEGQPEWACTACGHQWGRGGSPPKRPGLW